ncbi:MAG: hypothetical protein J6Q67_03355, partial [Clostridia bacterium]|nr:hypothetical protein [Clostridia bacterium]
MKKLIRIFAIVLSIALLSTAFVGCHEKDEIAYTIGEHKFTSAMYSCVLYVSASTARSAIRTYAEENDEDTKNIKYENYKFNDEGKVSATGTVKYKDFVKNEAIKVLKQYAVILDKMQKNNITIDDELVEEAKAQAYYYWYAGCDYSTYQYYSSYGADVSSYFTPYYEYFEPNGVAYSTYEQYMIYECYYNNYFLYLYDEGGEKEIPRDDLVESLTTHYALGDQFSISYLGNDNKAVSDDEK